MSNNFTANKWKIPIELEINLQIRPVHSLAVHVCDMSHFSVCIGTSFETPRRMFPSRYQADQRKVKCNRWSTNSIKSFWAVAVSIFRWTMDMNCHLTAIYPTDGWFYAEGKHLFANESQNRLVVTQPPEGQTRCLRENMVKNHGMAKSSGIKLISLRWLAKTGSWNAVNWLNLLRYSLMIDELSFKKNHCRYFGINLYRLRNARSENTNKK